MGIASVSKICCISKYLRFGSQAKFTVFTATSTSGQALCNALCYWSDLRSIVEDYLDGGVIQLFWKQQGLSNTLAGVNRWLQSVMSCMLDAQIIVTR